MRKSRPVIGLLLASMFLLNVPGMSAPAFANGPTFKHTIVNAPQIRPLTGNCPSSFVFCSNGNMGADVHSYTSNSVTVHLNSSVTTSGSWSYQYNLFWEDASSIWYVSQTTIEVSSSGCFIGTGYGTQDPYETQNSVTCSTVTSSNDYWEVATSWNQGFLSALTFYLNGNQLYSLTMSQICTGYPSCSINQSYDAYFQSVFVGADGSSPNAVFTSFGGTQSYSGAAQISSYPKCTGEESNAVYLAHSASGGAWTEEDNWSGSSAISNCI
jgi:hypothetical protein